MLLGLISFTSIPPEVTIASSMGRNEDKGMRKSFSVDRIAFLSSFVISLIYFLASMPVTEINGSIILLGKSP